MNCFRSSSSSSRTGPKKTLPTQRKLVILGDGACGKTSMLTVFTKGFFPQGYEPTVFENYVSEVRVNGQLVELSLWDTAGQEEFDRLRSLSYADTHVVMVCFSVDSRDSLENIREKWIPEIQEHCPGVKTVLVALKCDLRSQPSPGEGPGRLGPITYEEGLEVAKIIQASRYLECSAKENRGVVECFDITASVALTAKASGDGAGRHSKTFVGQRKATFGCILM